MKTIFLSHSGQNRDVAYAIYNILNQYIEDKKLKKEYKIFFSPESLKRVKENSQDWKQAIMDNIKKASTILVLWTPQSLSNRWVNYEMGMAMAYHKTAEIVQPYNPNFDLRKEFIAIGTNGIDYNLIIPGQEVISIEDEDNISLILSLVFNQREKVINKWINNNHRLMGENAPDRKLMQLFTKRCIYFVGSEQPNWSGTDKEHAKKFVCELSSKLLSANFKLASYPSVDYIGAEVAKTAFEQQEDYEISGLYMFDETVGELAHKWAGKTEAWQETMNQFRAVYLKNKHCMVILGGGKNTRNEYLVAIQQGVQVFPIPCFDGFSKALFDEQLSSNGYENFEHPCVNCTRKRTDYWRCDKIESFVERFKKYKVL